MVPFGYSLVIVAVSRGFVYLSLGKYLPGIYVNIYNDFQVADQENVTFLVPKPVVGHLILLPSPSFLKVEDVGWSRHAATFPSLSTDCHSTSLPMHSAVPSISQEHNGRRINHETSNRSPRINPRRNHQRYLFVSICLKVKVSWMPMVMEFFSSIMFILLKQGYMTHASFFIDLLPFIIPLNNSSLEEFHPISL